jgi:nicotinamidase-related amidase
MTKAIYETKHTALLVVDPYNDFMSEGGKLYNVTKPTADAVGFYANMRKLIPAFRASGIQVFVVRFHCEVWRSRELRRVGVVNCGES